MSKSPKNDDFFGINIQPEVRTETAPAVLDEITRILRTDPDFADEVLGSIKKILPIRLAMRGMQGANAPGVTTTKVSNPQDLRAALNKIAGEVAASRAANANAVESDDASASDGKEEECNCPTCAAQKALTGVMDEVMAEVTGAVADRSMVADAEDDEDEDEDDDDVEDDTPHGMRGPITVAVAPEGGGKPVEATVMSTDEFFFGGKKGGGF